MSGHSRKAALNAATRADFLTFLDRAFAELHAGDPLEIRWPLEAIAHRLASVDDGGARVIISMPPRSLKSVAVSVAWVAWKLGRDPALKFVCVSYSAELALKHARDCRTVMQSRWYQEVFTRTKLARSAEHDLVTTAGGGRFSTSVDGSLTGLGGDIIVIDDPLKPGEAASLAARTAVKEWYSSTLLSRLNDKQRGSIVLVMQRVHEADLAGHLLEAGGWDHLRLAAIAEEEDVIPLGGGDVHRRCIGEALDPEREPIGTLQALKRELGSAVFAAQYQQAPVPAEGALFKREWLTFYSTAPAAEPADRIIQSWDCASKEGVFNDWSVCVTACVRNRYVYILDVYRAKLAFPDLVSQAKRLAEVWRPETLLIEDAASGQQLIQVLRRDEPANMPGPLARQPQGDKLSRASGATAAFENGEVLLPGEASWLATYQQELLSFPSGRHDDQVDATVQLLEFAREKQRQQVLGAAGYVVDQYGAVCDDPEDPLYNPDRPPPDYDDRCEYGFCYTYF